MKSVLKSIFAIALLNIASATSDSAYGTSVSSILPNENGTISGSTEPWVKNITAYFTPASASSNFTVSISNNNTTVNTTVAGKYNGTKIPASIIPIPNAEKIYPTSNPPPNSTVVNPEGILPFDPYAQDRVVRSYCRGAGWVPSLCQPERPDYQRGLCYKKCADGYVGNGPVCWERCPERWINNGAFCWLSAAKAKAKKSYGRGVGVITNRCDSRWGVDQEMNGGLCYVPCPKGYYGIGPICYLVE